MTHSLVLTQQQNTALSNVVSAFHAKNLIRLAGSAGTGKTTSLKELVVIIQNLGYEVEVLTPTHKAKSVLKNKGISAKTIHEATLKRVPIKALWKFMLFLKGMNLSGLKNILPSLSEDLEVTITMEAIEAFLNQGYKTFSIETVAQFFQIPNAVVAKFTDFVSRPVDDDVSNRIALIDEASMVGRDLFDKFKVHFAKVIFVGDPNQLQPVNDDPIFFSEAPDAVLSENLRSTSAVVQLAHGLLNNTASFWDIPYQAPDLEKVISGQAVFITFKNETRIQLNFLVRNQFIKGKFNQLHVNEIILLKKNDAKLGIFNNQTALVHAIQRSMVTLYLPDSERFIELKKSQLYNEDDHSSHKKGIPYRFAYCLTAHSAQGGEWPEVYICENSLPTWLPTYINWIYTSVTRAQHEAFRFDLKEMMLNFKNKKNPPKSP